MIVFIDSDFKCHTTNDGTMTAVESDFFNGKCAAFIESCRFVPSGESWTREDGKVFRGEMIAPWRSSVIQETAQAQYERDLADLQKAYEEGVNSAYD